MMAAEAQKKDPYHILPRTGKCDKSLKHPVLHRAFLPGVSLQHSAPVFQLKYAPYSLLSREYYTCFPAKAQGQIWDLFCLGHFFGVGVNMLHAGVVEMLVKEHFQLAVGRIAAGAGIVRKQGIRLYKCYFALQNACWAVPKPHLFCIVPMQAAHLFQTLLIIQQKLQQII